MSANKRNVVVGATVLGALFILAGMLLKFGGTTVALFRSGDQVHVRFTGDRADGLAEGAQVSYLGQSVGRVLRVQRSPDNVSVAIDAEVDNTPPLPGNVEGMIRINSPIGGTAVLSLELVGAPAARPQGRLVDGQHMTAKFVGSELLPPEIAQLAGQLRDAKLVANLNDRVRESGEVLRGLRTYVDDPQTQAQLKATIADFRHISEVTSRSAENVERFSGKLDRMGADANAAVAAARADVDRVSRQVDDRMLQVAKLLDVAQAVAAKVNAGPGTAALLVNDPRLYQSLVDNSRDLNATVADLKRLVEQWEQEGVSLKLK